MYIKFLKYYTLFVFIRVYLCIYYLFSSTHIYIYISFMINPCSSICLNIYFCLLLIHELFIVSSSDIEHFISCTCVGRNDHNLGQISHCIFLLSPSHEWYSITSIFLILIISQFLSILF